ncbi:Secreted RxLR effector peptide protein [Phytophthora palmivora]|uniref:Secreted RxLR effector peptide protein n=1 Tax=Phytophthora palmivora TaxID=4796 RepID=A0A2P4X4Y8_9STRA|nr:Secreted RxLR effector peptide protein [Phytophthora palmivora]
MVTDSVESSLLAHQCQNGVRRLIKKGTSDTVLLENKVTPDEFFIAMRLDPKSSLMPIRR